MKQPIYIILTLCLALSSCGMTDVWKDWENEGTMSEDRLRPSEVKALLCSGDGWKMTYEGTTFFFQFTEGWNVTSDTDETMLQSAVETDYYLDYEGEDRVLLTIVGNGMLQYLSENTESTLVITSYSDSEIRATGQENGLEMILTPATTAEMQQAQEAKRQAIIAYNKAQAVELLATSLSNGLLRNASSSGVIAHYTFTRDDSNNWGINISYIEGTTLTHESYTMSVDTENDENAVLSIDGGLTVNGTSIATIYYGYETGTLSTNNTGVTVDASTSSDMLDMYNNSWSTHVVDRSSICEAFSTLHSAQLEFDDRSPRNIVVCPGDSEAGSWWYVMFHIAASADDNTGRIYFTNTGIELMFGNVGDNDIEAAQTTFKPLLDFCFSEDGFYMYEDSGYIYVVSPTSNLWFRMG